MFAPLKDKTMTLFDEKSSNVVRLPNHLEATMRMVMNNLEESVLDVAQYTSYCYQRAQYGMSVEQLKKIGFASHEQIDEMERIMNKELGDE